MLKIVFSASTMCAASPYLIADVSGVRGKSILLSTLVDFLKGTRNPAAAILFWAHLRPTVVVCIRLLTVCYVYTAVPDIPVATTVAMLWTGRTEGGGVALAGSEAGVRCSLGGRIVAYRAVFQFYSVVAYSCHLGFCRPAAAVVSLESGITGTVGV